MNSEKNVVNKYLIISAPTISAHSEDEGQMSIFCSKGSQMHCAEVFVQGRSS